MMKRPLDRLSWIAAMVMLGAVVLGAQLDVPTSELPELSVSSRLTALMGCVVPARAADPSASADGGPDAIIPHCDASTPDPLQPVWMTAC